MRKIAITAIASALVLAGWSGAAAYDPQEKYERKSPREWKYEYQDGRYVLKEERKGREYKYESKQGNSERKFERKKDGSWKEEVKVGNCTLKRERTSDGEYKEDRSC